VTPRWLRHALVAASIVLYALLEHYANTTRGSAAFGAALAIAPLLAAWLLLARRTPWPRLSLLAASLLVGTLLIQCWSRIERNFSLMFMLQQAGLYLILAVGFGRSLSAGQVPLCTRWATIVHGPLAAPVQRYTRSVTLAWTIFFVAIGLSSVMLYALAPLRTWSFFSNFLTLPLAALIFAIEYQVRRLRLPWMQRASLADTARAYLATTRGNTT
jgi:uncharacterized membrane protein